MPMPPDQQQAAPPQAAPPQGGPPQEAAPPPQGGPPQEAAPPPQGGGSVIEQLQAAGIDPQQLLQDPNMLQQVAQQFQADPNAIAQAIQQELQAGAGQQPPPQEAAAQPVPDVQELYAGMDEMVKVLEMMKNDALQKDQPMANLEGQIKGLAQQLDKVMSLIDETSGMPENIM